MIEIDRRYKNISIYLIPLIFAVIARIVLFREWSHSPFASYHLIPGLDMKTILTFAEILSRGDAEFSLYKLLLSFFIVNKDEMFFIPGIVMGQMLMGIASALLITFAATKFLRSRVAAIFAGIIAASYGPALLYECMILNETIFLFTAVLSLAALLFARKRFSSSACLFIAGATATLPAMVRFHGILWTIGALVCLFLIVRRKCSTHKKLNGFNLKVAPFIGSLTVLAIVSIYNHAHIQNWNPIPAFPKTSYALEVGATPGINNLSLPASGHSSAGVLMKMKNYAGKLISIFTPCEIPDNLNYYFVKEFLVPLKDMAGPLLLIPLALTGIIFILMKRKLKMFSILFVFVVCFSLPMVVFVPLARYRLMLLPAFCIFAGFVLQYMLAALFSRKKRYMSALGLLFTYALILSWSVSFDIGLRAEDFTAYGEAIFFQKGNTAEVEGCYRKAYEMNPTSLSAAIHLSNLLMAKGSFQEAEQILSGFFATSPGNPVISINYASSLIASGSPEKAEKILLSINEPDGKRSKSNYYYQLAESQRMQGKNDKAHLSYELALHYVQTEEQKQIIEKSIAALKSKTSEPQAR